MATKYVYVFGPQGTDGDASMKNLLGGKGANLAEMSRLGMPVPAGFTITTEFCTQYFNEGRKFPQSLMDEVAAALAKTETAMGMKYGAAENPLLLSCRSGAQVDARHDGNRAQRRPLSGDDPGPGREVGQRAVRLRRLSPLDHDVLRRGDGEGRGHRAGRGKRHPRAARAHHGQAEKREEVQGGHGHDRRGLEEAVRRIQEKGARGLGPALPGRSAGAALGGDRGGVQELAGAARGRLSEDRGDSRRVGHRLQRAEHGLRQHGRGLGHRRRLYAQPRHGREQVLRRMAGQRPGRRRRRRHPHAQSLERRNEERAEQASAFAANRHARTLPPTLRHPREAGEPLQGHAGHRVHDSGGQALHAPVPQRQADGHGGLEHGHGHARGEADRRDDRRLARRAGAVGRVAAPDHRSRGGEGGGIGVVGPAGGAGRGLRQDRLHLRRGRRRGEKRRRRDPRPRGDQSRGR